jgi:Kef-type K+ transport system membrane component KefB
MSEPIVQSFFLVFAGAALLATVALYARQALLVAYMLVGLLLGPAGLGLVRDVGMIEQAAEVGIIFLLFLLGLDLAPQDLLQSLRRSTVVTLLSSVAFAVMGYGVAALFGLPWRDALIVSVASMFSSTIIGVKLLPTTTLHHQRVGRVIVTILLYQDLLAIAALLLLEGYAAGASPTAEIALVLVRLPLLVLFAFAAQRYLLVPLLRRFDRIHEYIFLLAIAWCLGMAELAVAFGLSEPMGAFIAGVAMATHPIAMYITVNLKPLRDFFLVLFFVSLGAQLELAAVLQVLPAAALLALVLVLVKPWVFRVLLELTGERRGLAGEVGVRLGQLSEFSLLIVWLAPEAGFSSESSAQLVKVATLLTFVASSYWVVFRYPTPIAVSEHLRQD